MATNLTEAGESVYCQGERETRASFSLYASVRKYILLHSPQGTVLDLGSSDSPATFGLPNTTVGLDLSYPSLCLANTNGQRGSLVQADLEKPLPLKDPNKRIETVLLLDILEHLPEPATVRLLKDISANFPHRPLDVIVSMPIISWLSLCTWRAYLELAKNKGVRPATGLLDRTHILLTNREGHKRLFAQAGFAVTSEAYTCRSGVKGHPDLTVDKPPTQTKSKVVSALFEHIIPSILCSTYSRSRAQVAQSLNEFQGLYVLHPNET